MDEYWTYEVRPHTNSEGRFIIGLNGCHCHPFASWEECKKYHNQKFSVGDFVSHRHQVAHGTVIRTYKGADRNFVDVRCGPKKSDIHQENVANLNLITKKKTNK